MAAAFAWLKNRVTFFNALIVLDSWALTALFALVHLLFAFNVAIFRLIFAALFTASF